MGVRWSLLFNPEAPSSHLSGPPWLVAAGLGAGSLEVEDQLEGPAVLRDPTRLIAGVRGAEAKLAPRGTGGGVARTDLVCLNPEEDMVSGASGGCCQKREWGRRDTGQEVLGKAEFECLFASASSLE